MFVTPLPMVTLVRLEQKEKAKAAMLVTLSGIVMLVRLEEKTESTPFPMPETVRLFMLVGMDTTELAPV